MAVTTGMVFTAISLVLAFGLGICSAHRASSPGNLMEGVATKSTVAGVTEVDGKKNQPYKLNDLGRGVPLGDMRTPDSFPLSQRVGQARPVSCQGGEKNRVGRRCEEFSSYFDFNGPPEAYMKGFPPTATAVAHPPVSPYREREDGPGLLAYSNNRNEHGATASVAEPDPDK